MNRRHLSTFDADLAVGVGVVARGTGLARLAAGASRGLRRPIGAHL